MSIEVNVAKIEERIEALERWQTTQNGTLLRLAEKIDTLHAKMDSRFDAMKTWLIGALTSSLLVFAMLVVNMAIGKP